MSVGYSQHEGAERAEWGDDKLELVGGSHPVVHPAAGSHANFFGDGLYLGSSASQGVGCDDTTGPHHDLHPMVATIPSDPAQARDAVSVDRFRRALGRAPPFNLQWADRAEPQDSVDGADPVVGGVARQELHGADGKCVRNLGDRTSSAARSGKAHRLLSGWSAIRCSSASYSAVSFS